MLRLVPKRTVKAAIALVASLFLCSCGPSLDDRLTELVAAKNQWIDRVGDSHYSYDLGLGQNRVRTVRISNPGTLRADWLENPPCSKPGACQVNPTMREFYELVLELTNEQFQSGGVLRVEYDPDWGYPAEIFWDNRKAPHRVISFSISNVTLIDEGNSDICSELAQIERIPMKGDGDDPVYVALLARGTSVLPELAECVSDPTPMPDPREAPPYNGTAVGDVAFWTIVRIADAEIEDFLPEDYRVRWTDKGIYAYFDYVSNPEHRLALQAAVQQRLHSEIPNR